MRDLRISVTDRCNFRCTYCMPKEVFGRDYAFLPHDMVLTFEEITRLARTFVGLGVEKLRITGGEPLVRRDLPDLVAMLAAIRRPDGGEVDLTLTTNGSALRALARPLADAGLRRVTVSLDSLDDAVFGAMNGVDFPVAKVLDGIAAAREAGLAPIKVNMVVRRGINESSVVPMATWARDHGIVLRFIEYMDVGHSNGWRLDEVVPAQELIRTVSGVWAVEPADPNYRGEVAERWRYLDGRGEFGVISSVTQPCRDCTRAGSRPRESLYLPSCGGHDPGRSSDRRQRRDLAASSRDLVAGDGTELLGRTSSCRRSRCSRWAAEPARARASPLLSTGGDNSWMASGGDDWWITADRHRAAVGCLPEGADRIEGPRSHQGPSPPPVASGASSLMRGRLPRSPAGVVPAGRDRHPVSILPPPAKRPAGPARLPAAPPSGSDVCWRPWCLT
jgi:cyclic pyranopterin phosphate synthase